jgi:hypothetical protein
MGHRIAPFTVKHSVGSPHQRSGTPWRNNVAEEDECRSCIGNRAVCPTSTLLAQPTDEASTLDDTQVTELYKNYENALGPDHPDSRGSIDCRRA